MTSSDVCFILHSVSQAIRHLFRKNTDRRKEKREGQFGETLCPVQTRSLRPCLLCFPALPASPSPGFSICSSRFFVWLSYILPECNSARAGVLFALSPLCSYGKIPVSLGQQHIQLNIEQNIQSPTFSVRRKWKSHLGTAWKALYKGVNPFSFVLLPSLPLVLLPERQMQSLKVEQPS